MEIMTAAGTVELTVTDRGEGRTFLLLHGGGGPLTVNGFAELLEGRVLVPTHPGFAGTPRPDGLRTPKQLAALYVALLDQLDAADVTVIGNSMGGWIAAEMALTGTHRLAEVVLVNAVGIEVPGHPVADFFSLTFPQIAELSYYEPDKFRIDPAALPPQAQIALASNRAALTVYAGESMEDPTLRDRLAAVKVPVRVLWGESDRIVDPDYGRAFAAAIPGACFELLPRTGHLPQLESPKELLRAVL